MITFPDLPGCISDRKTPEEAIINGKDAVAAWIVAMQESGREILIMKQDIAPSPIHISLLCADAVMLHPNLAVLQAYLSSY